MIVWSGGTFILRWSCYNTKQELNAHWSIYPTHQLICRPPLSNHVVDMSHSCWYQKFPDDWRDQVERQKTRSGKWKWHFSGIPMTLSGSDYFDKERTGLTLPKGHLRRKTTFFGQKYFLHSASIQNFDQSKPSLPLCELEWNLKWNSNFN